MVFEIADMIECHITLPVGNRSVTVPFTGGGVYGYGTRPATFRTDDPTLIHIITHSKPFLSGRIKVKS